MNAKPGTRAFNLFLLAGYLAFKIPQLLDSLTSRQTGPDGGYYLSLAMNVRDGMGFVTHVSPFNQGLPQLPHYSSVYPLWPFLLGHLGRVFDIELLAHLLPAILHFISIPLAYLLGKMIFPSLELAIPRTRIRLNAGHILAPLVALNLKLAHNTVLPYTESLAWLLMVAFLIRCRTILDKRSVARALEFGLWLGLLFMVRSQFILASVAVGGWMLLDVWLSEQRRRRISENVGFFMTAGVAAVLISLPHLNAISKFALDGAFWSYMRFDQIQASRTLNQLQPMVDVHGAAGWALDRGRGLLVSLGFLPGGSFFGSFAGTAISIHLALGSLAIIPLKGRGENLRSSITEWLKSHPSNTYFATLAVGLWASLYTVHLKYWSQWPFHKRQGFAAAFAIFLFWGLILQSIKTRRQKAVLVSLLILTQFNLTHRWTHKVRDRLPPSPYPSMGAALETLIPGGLVTLPMDEGKLLSPWARSVGFHQFFDGSTKQDLACLKQKLGVQYLFYPMTSGETPDLPTTLGIEIPQDHLMKEIHGWRLAKIPETMASCTK